MQVPSYVTEFQRWHAASGPQRYAIVIQQAMTCVETNPDYDAEPNIFDVITPCGKRLGDCRKEDLEAMATWHRELAEAFTLLADES